MDGRQNLNSMTIKQVSEYLDDLLGDAKMCCMDTTAMLYLDDDTSIEVSYDSDYDCFYWSNGVSGYDSLSDVIDSVVGYLIDHGLNVKDVDEV